MIYKRDDSMFGMHGAACPYHCVCNGSHTDHCWCQYQGKRARTRAGWRERLRAWALGGGRARGRFDCPC